MVTIRPFEGTDADYEALGALERAVLGDQANSVAMMRHNDATATGEHRNFRMLAEEEGTLVGSSVCGTIRTSALPGRFAFRLLVDRAHQGRGIGSALYRAMRAKLEAYQPTLLMAETREDEANALRFLAHHGFEPVMCLLQSRLDVTTFDPAPFAADVERARAQGIHVYTVAELAKREPDWQRKVWDLRWEASQGMPMPNNEPRRRMTFEEFLERGPGSPAFRAEAWFVAVDEREGGRYVGIHDLLPGPDPALLPTGLTGVVGSHRRRGIATVLKLHGIAYARQQGVQIIETDNEENNPMYLINLKLGFKPAPAWITFHKLLGEQPAAPTA